MIRCFIVDDELNAISVLKRFIKRLPHLLLIGYETNPMQGIATIIREKPDLVFLDISMEEMNGIDVMKIVRQQTKVIFCTAFTEYAVKSYELGAVDYLLKPIAFDRFVEAVQRMQDVFTATINAEINANHIYIKWGVKGKLIKIDFDEIDYMQAKSNYVGIYRGENNILTYESMKEIDGRLPGNKFVRIHKSYIVALDKIAAVDNNVVVLKNKVQLPISSNYKEGFLAKMKGRPG
jgi:two-component system, LytTR family, response regulator